MATIKVTVLRLTGAEDDGRIAATMMCLPSASSGVATAVLPDKFLPATFTVATCFAEVTGLSSSWSLLSKILLRYRADQPSRSQAVRRRAKAQMREDSMKFRLSSFVRIMRSRRFEQVRTVSYRFPFKQISSASYLQYFTTREQN